MSAPKTKIDLFSMSYTPVSKTSELSPSPQEMDRSMTNSFLPIASIQSSSSSVKSTKTTRPQNVLSSAPVSKGPQSAKNISNLGGLACFSKLTTQDCQGLEDLLNGVDNSRKQDDHGATFQWVDIDLPPDDPDYHLLLFYLLQSCAVVHPNIIRHRDIMYTIDEDTNKRQLQVLTEKPTGPSLSQLLEYYAGNAEEFSTKVFWDCSAQLLSAAYALNKYKDGTFSPYMWSSSRLTADSIFFNDDGCVRLPQYYPLQKSDKKSGSAKRTKDDTSQAIVSVITELANIVTQITGVDRNIISLEKGEIKHIKHFAKRLAAYKTKPYININDLKFKSLSDAITLRQQGKHPVYPFPLKVNTGCRNSTTDRANNGYISPCSPPGLGVASDDVFNLSQDSTSSSFQPTPKIGDLSVDSQMPTGITLSTDVLSARTFSLFKKQQSTAGLAPIPNSVEASNHHDTGSSIPAATCVLYESICKGLIAMKETANKMSRTPSKSKGSESGSDVSEESDLKYMLADRKVALFTDLPHEIGGKLPTASHGSSSRPRSSLSAIVSKRKRPRALLNGKCMDEIKLYYEGNDMQLPAIDRDDVCPRSLYLDAITNSNNYDDTDRCINNDKLFTLLLSIDISNQLIDLEQRVISFLKRDASITKIVACYFLGEIADESPPFTHKQRRDIYLLFPKLFTHISANIDLLERILNHQFFKKTFFEMILDADSWLKLTTVKGKEGMSLKDALISKVRKEAFETFLREIFSRADAIRFVRTALHGRYNEIMIALIQLQFASLYIKLSISMRLFDSPLIELTLNTLLGLVQDTIDTREKGSIGKIMCISNHLVTCLHTDPTKFKSLTEKMHKLKSHFIDLLFSNDSELVSLSAYILELVMSYYATTLCMSVQTHIMASTGAVTNTITEIIDSMAEFANNMAAMYTEKNREMLASDSLRIQLILMLILRLILASGDAARTAFAWAKESAHASSQDSYSQQCLQAQSLDCNELRKSVMNASVYTGLELPAEWSNESYASLRNQLRDILKRASGIVGPTVAAFLERITETERFCNATIIHFLIARVWISLADTLNYFGAESRIDMTSIRKRLQPYKNRSIKSIKKSSEFIFTMAIPQKVIMIAMASEPGLTAKWSCPYYSLNSVVLFSLDISHWTWLERNTDKVESAAKLFGLSAKEVLEVLKLN